MATEFAMPAPSMGPVQYTTSPTHYNLYGTQSQPISPASSSNVTPHNSSPTSPRTPAGLPLPAHPRQLRPPKSPLYVPAVLRPTDPPKKQSSITPPQSMNNSFDSLNNVRPLSRTSTVDSGKYVLGPIDDGTWDLSGFPKVTEPPSRNHWKADSEASICDEAICTKPFSYFNRRHHCRRCGNIFCDSHSSEVICLDQDANFHPRGTPSRACAHCFNEYQGWKLSYQSRTNSESSEDQPMTPTTPIVSCMGKGNSAIGSVFGPRKDGTPESMGQSVPRDWNWSTF